jgi:hypothetical protein
MSPGASLDVLVTQLQIQMERLETLVVTSPLKQGGVELVAQRIVSGLRSRDIATTLYLPASSYRPDEQSQTPEVSISRGNAAPPGPLTLAYTPAQVGTPQLARSLLTSPGTITVAAAPGVLEDPTALLLAATADAVLLVVESGRTTRADLKRARLELTAAGGHLVGAVLHE